MPESEAGSNVRFHSDFPFILVGNE